MYKSSLFTLLITTFIVSCTNQQKYEKITGSWECVSWINKAKGVDKCNNNVHFEFGQDKSYESILGRAHDSGTFKIQNNRLYITPRDKMEFAVEIQRLSQDTMVFLMNLAGNPEIMTLQRKK
jgi:hypothetical protein